MIPAPMIAAAAWLFGGRAQPAAAPANPASLASVSPPASARAPMQLKFVDQHARSVTLGELAAGKPLVLVPVQHRCRNLCGLTLATLRATLSAQPLRPGADFTVVSFGIDPRETPADAAWSAARLGGIDASGIEATVGDAVSDAAVTNALGYRYTWVAATGQYAHVAAVAVLTPDGRLERWLPGLGAKPGNLQMALQAAALGRTPPSPDPIRLLCFHFDPTTGRYSLAVWRLLQWGAGAGAVFTAAGVGVALWRERRSGTSA